MDPNFIPNITKQFKYYKLIAENAIAQLTPEQLNWQSNAESNSINMIINHMVGNMLSRFTDFLTTDGEKEWRNRDAEFETSNQNKETILIHWEKGWTLFFTSIASLNQNDLEKIIYIRNTGQTVAEALCRQLAHYPYHIGQIVFIAKMISGNAWVSLSIPKGNSQIYNAEKFSGEKTVQHFTDEFLKKD